MGVVVEFLVGVELLELGALAIVGSFTGKDFKTKIRGELLLVFCVEREEWF